MGQGLDCQNKAHLRTWVGFIAAQCAERRVNRWSEQLAGLAMDQLGPWASGRLAVSPPCRACGVERLERALLTVNRDGHSGRTVPAPVVTSTIFLVATIIEMNLRYLLLQ